MKNYIAHIGSYSTYEKRACIAASKKDAAKKMGVKEYKVQIASCHIDFIRDAIKF